jgi:hypothetical protein
LERRVPDLLVANMRIERVAENRGADRRHVNSQLVLLARLRGEAKEAEVFADFEQLNSGHRIHDPVDDALDEPWRAVSDPVFNSPVSLCGVGQRRDRKVLSCDGRLREKPMIVGAGLSIHAEEDQPSGFPVEAVYGRQRLHAGALLQAEQQRPFHVLTCRRHRHSMGLVGNEDLSVAVENDFAFGRRRFCCGLPFVVDGDAVPIGGILAKRSAVFQRDAASPDPFSPGLRGHVRKMRDQMIEYRCRRGIELLKIET